MATISTHLRNFKEPTKDQLTQLFFSLPVDPQIETNSNEKASPPGNDVDGGELERMEISATLSLGVSGVEEPYVSPTLFGARRTACSLGRVPVSLARKVVPHPAVPCVHLFGSQVRAVHRPAVHSPPSRKAQCSCRHLCPQLIAVA